MAPPALAILAMEKGLRHRRSLPAAMGVVRDSSGFHFHPFSTENSVQPSKTFKSQLQKFPAVWLSSKLGIRYTEKGRKGEVG